MDKSAVSVARPSEFAVLVACIALAAAATALWLFPRALPSVALEQALTRDMVRARADSFFQTHALAPPGAQTAVRFQGNDSLATFVGLAGGGHDSLNALVRGQDVTTYTWAVRAFVPDNPREARVEFAPDGRIVGFTRVFAEADTLPEISADSGRVLAESVLGTWVNERLGRWKFLTSSYVTKKTSGRVDRSYTFERNDRMVSGAPIRVEVRIAGNTPSGVRPFVEIPESFRRRYGEMRSANELFALVADLGMLVIAGFGIVFLFRASRMHHVRWRPAMLVAGVIGVMTLLSGLNGMPGSWFYYDTATSRASFQAILVLGAIAAGGLTLLQTGFTLAAAESATRQAFPRQLDWWKLWRYRGTKEVASRVAGGYAASCIAFAYVAIFYLVTRKLFGWWVPSELLDDPNQIASPMPWISGIAASLNAGVWEESLFRALPLAMLSLWVGQRANRKWWMAAGVVVTAAVFGFAHSNYASWPPYSRGIEIFLDACFWAVLFLNFGLIVTVVAHFVYDLVLFGLFAAAGTAIEYRISAAVLLLALLAPALAVAGQWFRQRRLVSAPDDAFFGAYTIAPVAEPIFVPATRRDYALSKRARPLAMGATLLALVVALAKPPAPTLGPAFSVNRAQVMEKADAMLAAHGENPAGWRKLTAYGTADSDGWRRYLQEYKMVSQAQQLAKFKPAAWWSVRYVHSDAPTVQQRTEEWRLSLWPDGRTMDFRHTIADSAVRPSADANEVRRIARLVLAHAGVDTTTLRESQFRETARPLRKDVTVMFTDTSVKLPAGAEARVWVDLAGNEPLAVHRDVELSEAFLRAQASRQTNRMVIGAVAMLLLLGGIVGGAIVATRKREILIEDGHLSRKITFAVIGLLMVLAAADQVNGLPSALYSYATSDPWNRFLANTAAGYVSVAIMGLLVLGMWLAFSALRRRAGIPMIPATATANDVLVAGLGIGATFFALEGLDSVIALSREPELPHAPGTLLNNVVPWLGGVFTTPSTAFMMVVAASIPLLVMAALTRRWALRIAMAVLMLGLVVTVMATFASTEELNVRDIASLVLQLVVAALALRAWGTFSAVSWLVAGLVMHAFEGLRRAAYAPTGVEHVAGALTLLVAGVCVALLLRSVRRYSAAPAT